MPGIQAVVVIDGLSDVVEFRLGDVVRLRRVHPCGSQEWLVDRLGADIGLRCRMCDRHVLLARRKLERRLMAFVSRGDLAMSQAVAPGHATRVAR
jgi:hypothetical protein